MECFVVEMVFFYFHFQANDLFTALVSLSERFFFHIQYFSFWFTETALVSKDSISIFY